MKNKNTKKIHKVEEKNTLRLRSTFCCRKQFPKSIKKKENTVFIFCVCVLFIRENVLKMVDFPHV